MPEPTPEGQREEGQRDESQRAGVRRDGVQPDESRRDESRRDGGQRDESRRDEGHQDWESRRRSLGAFIRDQRTRANLSLRQLAELTSLSNPYLSQIERGLHQPSVRVLKAISDALNLSAETLLTQAGLIDAMTGGTRAGQQAGGQPAGGGQSTGHTPPSGGVEEAIRAEERLSEDQKTALITVYRTMLAPGG
ncbi:MAG: helix-turn-helix domain-containing protein [Nocardiopsaceae bacterium]|nr:helix-turn-helix domain-containing protein [Nocardiopsaceae bacterium]